MVDLKKIKKADIDDADNREKKLYAEKEVLYLRLHTVQKDADEVVYERLVDDGEKNVAMYKVNK